MDSDLMIRTVNWTKRINTLANLVPDSKKALELGVAPKDIRSASRAVGMLTPLLMGMGIDPMGEEYASPVAPLAKEGSELFDDLCEAKAFKYAHTVNAALAEISYVNTEGI